MANLPNSEDHGHTHQIFIRAKESFLDNISEREKECLKHVNSPDQLIQALEASYQWSHDRKGWGKALQKIHSFKDILQPYFRVITTRLQVHPEFSSLAWGSIYLMLKLVSNFTSFFTKLADILADIATQFPRYEDLMEHATEFVSENLRLSLYNLYSDIFEFIVSVTRIFTKKDGTLRKGPSVASKLMWQPFESRFENFSKRLKFHKDTLAHELQSVQVKGIAAGLRQSSLTQAQISDVEAKFCEYEKVVGEMLEKLTDEKFESKIDGIRRFLNHAEDVEELDRADEVRAEGTAEWLFDEIAYQEWMLIPDTVVRDCSSGQNLLSVTGIPGSGKTVIAANVLQRVQSLVTDTSSAVCYHFFSYVTSQKQSVKFAVQAILFQLLNALSAKLSVLEAFSFAANIANKKGRTISTTAEMKDLLSLILWRLQSCIIVIDGLDECKDPESVVNCLVTTSQSTNTKIIFFSRPNIDAFSNYPDYRRLRINNQKVNEDILHYLRPNVETLIRKKLFDPSADIEILLRGLLIGADSMFLWAYLMVEYLKSPALTQKERKAAIMNLKTPDTLDAMYYRILHLILMKAKEEQNFARQLFICIAHSRRLLKKEELQCMLNPFESDFTKTDGQHPGNDYPDFEHAVIMVSGSLVEMSEGRFRFIHMSVQDFFKIDHMQPHSKPELCQVSNKFRPSVFEANCVLTDTCLTYLLYCMSASPLSGNMLEKAAIGQIVKFFPLLSYIINNWTHHLELSIPEHAHSTFVLLWKPHFDTLSHRLELFLGSPLLLMSWVEALYTFIPLDEHFNLYSRLYCFTKSVTRSSARHFGMKGSKRHREVSTTLNEFTKTLEQYFDQWSSVLSEEPNQIWQDVTAYSPTKFFLSTRATNVRTMAARRPMDPKYSTKPLTTMSQTFAEYNNLVTLTIWTSRSYEMLWSEAVNSNVQLDLDSQCRHWIARYELWSTDSSSTEPDEEYQFELDQTVVENHLHKFLAYIKTRSSSAHKWALPIPITIARNLRSFAILSEIFIRVRNTGHCSDWERHFLPLESIQGGHQMQPRGHGLSLQIYPYYALQFNDDSSAILYLQKKVLSTLAESGIVSLLAVFSLKDTEGGQAFVLSGTKHGELHDTEFKHCNFHPYLPLLVYQRRSLFSATSAVELWSFGTHPVSQERCIQLISLSGTQITTKIIEYVNFTVSGMEVIIQWQQYARQEIISISKHPMVRALEDWATAQGSGFRSNDPDGSQMVISSDSLNHALILPEKGIKSGQRVRSHESITQVSFHSSGNKRKSEIALVTRSLDGKETQQPLTHIPNWSNTERLDISVEHSPNHSESADEHSHGDEHVRKRLKLIISQTPKEFSTMEEPLNENLPAMVTKDLRALGRARVRSPKSRTFRQQITSQEVLFLENAVDSGMTTNTSDDTAL